MRLSQGKIRFLWVLALLFVVVAPLYIFSKQIKGFFYSFSAPIQKPLGSASNNFFGFLSGVFNSGNLKKEIDGLKARNGELSSKLVELEAIKNENETLRHAIDMDINKDFKVQVADITSKDISGDYIVIDKGSNSGIGENMAVITNEKIVVGRIVEVYKDFSRVMLISNKKSSFDAAVDTRDTAGVLRGGGNMSIILDLIPREKDIFEGDLVKTSNIAGIFPPDILVGRIIRVRKNDVESIQQADVELGFDIRGTSHLFVIIGK